VLLTRAGAAVNAVACLSNEALAAGGGELLNAKGLGNSPANAYRH
jgi:hypothetical protein